MERPYFPMFVDLTGKKVLTVGGGRIALRRVRTLLQFGAQICVIAPELCGELADLESEGRIRVSAGDTGRVTRRAQISSLLQSTAGRSTVRCGRSAERGGSRSMWRMIRASATFISLLW